MSVMFLPEGIVISSSTVMLSVMVMVSPSAALVIAVWRSARVEIWACAVVVIARVIVRIRNKDNRQLVKKWFMGFLSALVICQDFMYLQNGSHRGETCCVAWLGYPTFARRLGTPFAKGEFFRDVAFAAT